MKRKDFAIGELPAAETMDTESLFAVEQEGLSKHISGELISGFIKKVSDKANQVSMSGGATLIVQGITGGNHIIEIKDDGLSGGGSSVEMVEQATPVITIDEDTGYVTAQATQEYGIVNGGTKTATKQITATTLVPENIKSGVSILGVQGNYSVSNAPAAVEQATPVVTINESTGNIHVTSTQEYGIVSAGTKTVDKQIESSTLIPENIKIGVNIFGVIGTLEAGAGSSLEEVSVRITNELANNSLVIDCGNIEEDEIYVASSQVKTFSVPILNKFLVLITASGEQQDIFIDNNSVTANNVDFVPLGTGLLNNKSIAFYISDKGTGDKSISLSIVDTNPS